MITSLILIRKCKKNLKSGSERRIFDEAEVELMKNWPVTIDKNYSLPPGKTAALIPLNENEEEYKRVQAYFKMNMPTEQKVPTGLQATKITSTTTTRPIHKITAIQKIINPKLREHYEFLLSKIKCDNNNNDDSIQYTRLLWHGSGGLAPPVIYEDVHYGWKINYASEKNLWGKGLYFGEDVQYCHKYVYKTPEGRRQIFLAEVITGDDIICLEDGTIKEPWMKEDGKTRFDSVCGVRHDKSWIWIVYASGRAYPTYLVEYED